MLKHISGWFEYSLAGAEIRKRTGSLTGTFAYFAYFCNYAYYTYNAYHAYYTDYAECFLHIMHISAAMEGMVWNLMHWHFWERWVQSLYEENVCCPTIFRLNCEMFNPPVLTNNLQRGSGAK